jgi:hypothetical protein
LLVVITAVLSGKELFNYNAALFVDDESAFDTSNDNVLNEEMKVLQEKEELQIKEEYERAQAEQQRLVEIQLVEMKAREFKEADKKQLAMAANRATFVFNGVTINQIVFEEDDDEDLELFADEEPFVPNMDFEMSEAQQQEMIELIKAMNVHDISERLHLIEAQLKLDEQEEEVAEQGEQQQLVGDDEEEAEGDNEEEDEGEESEEDEEEDGDDANEGDDEDGDDEVACNGNEGDS